MAGHSLGSGSTLQCAHGGTVQIVTTNVRAKAGDALVTSTDTFTISGCPFQIPAVVPIPSPCVQARWVVSDARVKVNGNPCLSRSDVALCFSPLQVPQGPAVVAATQTSTSSQ